MTMHQKLVERAVSWLYGTMRCNVVFSGNASTVEIPDAIGWGTNRRCDGSIVVECKTSTEDFLRDKRKGRMQWSAGYEKKVFVPRKRMGNVRYFLTTPGTILPGQVLRHYPDHGLIYMEGRRVPIVVEAPIREDVNHDAEIRFLQFALVHIRKNLVANGVESDLNRLSKWVSG